MDSSPGFQEDLHSSQLPPPANQNAFKKAFSDKYKHIRAEFLNRRHKHAAKALLTARASIHTWTQKLSTANQARTPQAIPKTVHCEGPGAVANSTSEVKPGTNSGTQGEEQRKGAATDSGSSASAWQLPLTESVRYKVGRAFPVSSKIYKGFKVPKAATIPAYTAWVYIPKNEQDRDNDRRMFYTDEIGETVPASDEEVEYEVWYWNGKDLQWRNFCLEQMREEFGESKELYDGLAEKLKVDVDAIETRFKEMARARSETVLVNRVDGKMEDGSLVFQQAFCRRCGAYECRLHGGNHFLPGKPPERLPSPKKLTPCGEDCYLNSRKEAHDSSEPVRTLSGTAETSALGLATVHGEGSPGSSRNVWTEVEVGFVSQGVLMFGVNPCEIARLFAKRTCADVHQYLETNPTLVKFRHSQVQKVKKKPVRRKTFQNRKGSLVAQKRFRHNEAELWHSYSPCNCKNGCNSSCSCYQTKNFCEKYCGCFPGCINQWKGCKCAHRCDTQRCPCLSASRECDPDYCYLCRKTCEPGCLPEDECKNMNLRLRKHKRVAMGLSTVAGWGGFLMDSAKKDDFLGEYTGDLITDQEAERRGRIYDRQDKSYLFNLTKEKVLDANRRGNKLRFANHSKDPNCYVKYMLVDGDHRVGIFAGRDIKPGEEIFYDYGGAWCSKWYDPEKS